MASHLSAAKISLIVLVSTYVDGTIPDEAVVDVLSFVASRINPRFKQVKRVQHKKKDTNDAAANFVLSLQDFEEALTPLEVHYTRPDGTELHLTVWRLFAAMLLAVQSLDHMSAMLTEMLKLVFSEHRSDQDWRPLSPISPLGLFARRVRVEFEALQFQDAMKLWHAFEMYRQPLQARRDELAMADIDRFICGFGGDPELSKTEMDFWSQMPAATVLDGSLKETHEKLETASINDMERYLEFQIDKMRGQAGYLPDTTHSQISSMMRESTKSSKLYDYARQVWFLEAWYKGDYASCFEHLRRYYDYAMNDTDKRVYQNVLLQMAVVQADFGCYSEALAAIGQAISVARENKDKICLHYCLSWLLQVRFVKGWNVTKREEGTILGSDTTGTEYLKAMGRRDHIPGIHIPALFEEARLSMAQGQGLLVARERLYEAEHLITHHRIRGFRASHDLLLSQVYHKLGLTRLAIAQSMLAATSAESPLECRTGAKCSIAVIASNAGQYKKAFDALQSVEDLAKFNLRADQYLKQCVDIVKLKKAVHNNDRLLAERLIETLKLTPCEDPALDFMAILLEIEHLARTEELSRAFELLHESWTSCEEQAVPDVCQRIQLMCIKVQLYSRIGRPNRGFSNAVRAVIAAERTKDVRILLEATQALVTVFIGLEQWDKALAVVESAKGRTIETQDAFLLARLAGMSASAYIGRGKSLKKDEEEQRRMWEKASTWLTRGQEAYKNLEDTKGQEEMAKKLQAVTRLYEQG